MSYATKPVNRQRSYRQVSTPQPCHNRDMITCKKSNWSTKTDRLLSAYSSCTSSSVTTPSSGPASSIWPVETTAAPTSTATSTTTIQCLGRRHLGVILRSEVRVVSNHTCLGVAVIHRYIPRTSTVHASTTPAAALFSAVTAARVGADW